MPLPYTINVANDEAESDSLGGALQAVSTLREDQGLEECAWSIKYVPNDETPTARVEVSAPTLEEIGQSDPVPGKPGVRLWNGREFYSSAWL